MTTTNSPTAIPNTKNHSEDGFVTMGEDKAINYSVLLLWLAAIIAVCGTAFFWFLNKSTADELADKQQKKDAIVAEIVSPTLSDVEKEAIAFKSSVATLVQVSKSRYELNVFMPLFYQKVMKNVVIKNISVTADGTLSFDGTTDSYKSAGLQLIALQDWKINSKAILKNVNMLSSSEDIKDGKAIVSFSVSAKIMKNVSLVEEKTTTSSISSGTSDTLNSEGGLSAEE